MLTLLLITSNLVTPEGSFMVFKAPKPCLLMQIKNVMDACFCAVAFWSFGWALGFGDGSRFIGWKDPAGQNALFDAGDQVGSPT